MTASHLPATEAADQTYRGLDVWADDAILTAMLDGQRRAVASVESAISALAKAADLVAGSLRGEGRLIYLGAGSPALICLGDALELPQTFGIPRERIVLCFAGGHAITENLTGPFEDDVALARADIATLGIRPGDSVVAVSASGSTPYTVAALEVSRKSGAATVAIAGNAGAVLFDHADVAVLLDAGPEVISGSTRMGAGTAQKVALNMLSTLVGIRLGHVHDNFMVNVNADNLKLKRRAERMVAAIAGVSEDIASSALSATAGLVKPAILIAAGATPQDATRLLGEHNGVVRNALAALHR